MKLLSDFDLSNKYGRFQARKHGFEVPIYKPYDLVAKKDFWSFVDVKSVNECWNWIGKVNYWGYGTFYEKGFSYMAHRYAYQSKTKLNIEGFIAMHICDNPACCNPNHLVMGTHADNQKDKYKKNRQAKGEMMGSSILTNEQVIEARKRYIPHKVTYQMLAEEYGVCKDTMQKAIRKIYWKHL
jgi:hypothetical protein